jgi:hypothetical protein
MFRRVASVALASLMLILIVGPASVLAAEQPPPEIVVTKGLSASHDGPYAVSATVPTGSVLWNRIVVRNDGSADVYGIALTDTATGGTLPAGCAGIPSPLAPGAAYTCLYRAAVVPGVVASIATASYSGRSSSAIAVAVGTGNALVTNQPAGLGSSANSGKPSAPTAPGVYGPQTAVVRVGDYVTWRAVFGSDFAGLTIGVAVAERVTDGSWGPFKPLTSRVADEDGAVTFSWTETSPRWLSIRFAFDATTTYAVQAVWQ